MFKHAGTMLTDHRLYGIYSESEVADCFIIKSTAIFHVVTNKALFIRKQKSQQQPQHEKYMKKKCKIILFLQNFISQSIFSEFKSATSFTHFTPRFFSFFLCAVITLDVKFLWINSFWKQSTLVICSFLLYITLSGASSNVIVELASIF